MHWSRTKIHYRPFSRSIGISPWKVWIPVKLNAISEGKPNGIPG